MRLKIRFLLRILIYTGRDMLVGLLLGYSAMVLLHRINPRISGIGLIAVLGILAGVLKGLAKSFLLSKLDVLAHDEFRKSYPKHKILALWFTLLIGALIYSYGLNITRWFNDPFNLIFKNGIIDITLSWWIIIYTAVFTVGLISHFINPPRPNK